MASGRADVKPFLVMEVLEEAERLSRTGVDIVHFEVGEPDFDTPEPVKAAARLALERNETHYTHSLGLRELREAIAEHYRETYGAAVSADEVMVTSGTSPALSLLFSALLEPGDEVILSNPYYACYPNFIQFAGGIPVFVDIHPEEGYQFRADAVRARLSPRTRAILVNSPANPTGVVLEAGVLSELTHLGPLVVSDEVYHGLVYEGRAASVLESTDTRGAAVLNGFSKLYAMTGWRLGYAIARPDLIRAMQKLHQNFAISASAFVQRAGIAALTETSVEIELMRRTYDERRRFMLDALARLGLRVPVVPTGAFYVLVDCREYTHDSLGLAYALLREAHVAVTPGIDFGSNAEGYIRLSYATSIERIAEGVGRLGRYLAASLHSAP
jgi:(5-formylfuran-3-yl)methyl phosphate transaminase